MLGVTAHREGINGEDNIFSCAFCSTTIKYIDHAPHDVETSNCSDWGRGLHGKEVAYLLLTQQPGFNYQHSRNLSRGKIIDVAEVDYWRWLEESGQWLENVD